MSTSGLLHTGVAFTAFIIARKRAVLLWGCMWCGSYVDDKDSGAPAAGPKSPFRLCSWVTLAEAINLSKPQFSSPLKLE